MKTFCSKICFDTRTLKATFLLIKNCPHKKSLRRKLGPILEIYGKKKKISNYPLQLAAHPSVNSSWRKTCKQRVNEKSIQMNSGANSIGLCATGVDITICTLNHRNTCMRINHDYHIRCNFDKITIIYVDSFWPSWLFPINHWHTYHSQRSNLYRINKMISNLQCLNIHKGIYATIWFNANASSEHKICVCSPSDISHVINISIFTILVSTESN